MKNDLFSRRFFTICAGLAIVMLSACALVLSVNHATATPSVSDEFKALGEMPAEGANYMMDYQTYSQRDGSIGYNVLVWNPTTGKSRIYFYHNSEGRMVNWETGALPVDPLP